MSRIFASLFLFGFALTVTSGSLWATPVPSGPKVSLLGSPRISTVAGNGGFGYSGDGAAATEAQLTYPYGVAVDGSGNIYIADSSNYAVRVVNTQNIAITVAGVTIQPGNIATVAGNGSLGNTGNDGPATSAQIGWTAGIDVDASGNIFIADTDFNVIRKITSSGTISIFAGTPQNMGYGCGYYNNSEENGDGGPATSAILGCPYAVAVDGTGNVYIADIYGNRIRKVDTEGTITTVAGSGSQNYGGCYEEGTTGDGGPATSATLDCPVDVNLDAAGNVYIADYVASTIRVVNMQATAITVGGVTIQPGNIDRIAGTGQPGFSGDGGPATSAQLFYPFGVAVDGFGNIYIGDYATSRIRKVDISGTITTIAGTGESGYSGDGGPAENAQFSYPTKLTVDSFGNIYVADTENAAIRKISGNGGGISVDFAQVALGENTVLPVKLYMNADVTIGSIQASGDYSVVEAPATIRSNSRFAASTRAAQPNLERIPAQVAKLITKARAAGNFMPRIAQDQEPAACIGAFTQADVCTLYVRFTPTKPGPRWFQLTVTDTEETNYKFGMTGTGVGPLVSITPGIINTPEGGANIGAATGLVRDNAGNTYVADYQQHVVFKINFQGQVSTVAGILGEDGYDGDGGPAVSAHLNDPINLTLDSLGNLYIADTLNNAIRKVDTNGIITTVAGTGTAGYSGDGSLATNAKLDNPLGVLADKSGNLYIADTYNNVVRKVDINGRITTVAGNGSGAGNGSWEQDDPDGGWTGDDGPATQAQLNGPTGLALDSNGNLYIADTFNSAIRKVDGEGTIWTIAGLCGDGCSQGYSGDGGSATSAELNFPYGLSLDAAGDLYIADTNNSAIRKVASADGVITTVAHGQGAPLVHSSAMAWRSAAKPKIVAHDQAPNIGDGGLATDAILFVPVSVWVDNNGSFYLTDVAMGYVRKVDATTSKMNFGEINPESTSESQSVTVSNAGNAALNLSQISLSANFDWVEDEGICSTEVSLSSGSSCRLITTFTPPEGGNYSGSIILTNSGFTSPNAIALEGVGTQPDYTITSDPTTLSIHRGQTGTATLTITPLHGYTGTVQFACSGLPAYSSCTFAPTSVTLDGETAATVTLTVTTTGTGSQTSVRAAVSGSIQTPGAPLNLWFLPVGLAGVVLYGVKDRRRMQRWLPIVLCIAVLTGIVVLNGCGSSSHPTPPPQNNNVTPLGTFSATVTTTADATAGSGQHSAPITITVVQ